MSFNSFVNFTFSWKVHTTVDPYPEVLRSFYTTKFLLANILRCEMFVLDFFNWAWQTPPTMATE